MLENKSRKKLALFDLDGTLFDTRKANWLAYQKALSQFNIQLNYDFFAKYCNGRHYSVFVPELLKKAGHEEITIAEKSEIVHNEKKELYSTYLSEIKINEHLFNLIECMKKIYYTALVTTASRKNSIELLEFYDKTGCFDYIITAEDVKKKKPDPEGFLLAMKKFNISAHETIIFEDSDVGIQAAENTGATVFVARGFA